MKLKIDKFDYIKLLCGGKKSSAKSKDKWPIGRKYLQLIIDNEPIFLIYKGGHKKWGEKRPKPDRKKMGKRHKQFTEKDI